MWGSAPPPLDLPSFPLTSQSEMECMNSHAATLAGRSGEDSASWAALGSMESSHTCGRQECGSGDGPTVGGGIKRMAGQSISLFCSCIPYALVATDTRNHSRVTHWNPYPRRTFGLAARSSKPTKGTSKEILRSASHGIPGWRGFTAVPPPFRGGARRGDARSPTAAAPMRPSHSWRRG